jgi:hypothetical protein
MLRWVLRLVLLGVALLSGAIAVSTWLLFYAPSSLQSRIVRSLLPAPAEGMVAPAWESLVLRPNRLRIVNWTVADAGQSLHGPWLELRTSIPHLIAAAVRHQPPAALSIASGPVFISGDPRSGEPPLQSVDSLIFEWDRGVAQLAVHCESIDVEVWRPLVSQWVSLPPPPPPATLPLPPDLPTDLPPDLLPPDDLAGPLPLPPDPDSAPDPTTPFPADVPPTRPFWQQPLPKGIRAIKLEVSVNQLVTRKGEWSDLRLKLMGTDPYHFLPAAAPPSDPMLGTDPDPFLAGPEGSHWQLEFTAHGGMLELVRPGSTIDQYLSRWQQSPLRTLFGRGRAALAAHLVPQLARLSVDRLAVVVHQAPDGQLTVDSLLIRAPELQLDITGTGRWPVMDPVANIHAGPAQWRALAIDLVSHWSVRGETARLAATVSPLHRLADPDPAASDFLLFAEPARVTGTLGRPDLSAVRRLLVGW